MVLNRKVDLLRNVAKASLIAIFAARVPLFTEMRQRIGAAAGSFFQSLPRPPARKECG
jgi:hypothetical protein